MFKDFSSRMVDQLDMELQQQIY